MLDDSSSDATRYGVLEDPLLGQEDAGTATSTV
jgi:hypothetical protein